MPGATDRRGRRNEVPAPMFNYHYFSGTPGSGGPESFIEVEDGGLIVLETGTGFILLEDSGG